MSGTLLHRFICGCEVWEKRNAQDDLYFEFEPSASYRLPAACPVHTQPLGPEALRVIGDLAQDLQRARAALIHGDRLITELALVAAKTTPILDAYIRYGESRNRTR
jgi:hypothetical protein